MSTLSSRAERSAETAEDLPCFSGLKLAHIRRAVVEALAQVGHNGIFEQYTKHDISHIDHMLASLDWLIPEATWAELTPTDSLLHVLSIYLHDLGMLVTEAEFAQRATTDWPSFVDTLYAGDGGADYRARVAELGHEASERFLYQEYVRAHHGERIKAWITASPAGHLGMASDAAQEISTLLQPLPSTFREDLGLVCESHHRDDLGDVKRYAISRPYGSSHSQEANVQYAALVLRTADLLHITSDRTPSITYRLVAPSDPVSQQEWAKQMAVTAVRSKPALDDDGNVDLRAQRDTIEVCAQFTDEDGFFGLTAYLTYARHQLLQTHDWASESLRRHGAGYEFPWRYIDDNEIRTSGFLRDSFEFTLDTKRVLDLLTGHTLYNNTSVVIRELVQNSLDAIRVLAFQGSTSSSGKVLVQWDSAQRRLTVIDNGTGMSQDVIERHLLRVGSSRYQDAEFIREHPGFSPISRFGIGVLSTFMISDAVTITTVHPDDSQGRQLSLRSVHGRYLIRLFDKTRQLGHAIGEHGTSVSLRLRPSAKMDDVQGVLEQWVVVPGCGVALQLDDADPIDIGFASIGDALRSRLEQDGYACTAADESRPKDGDICVEEVEDVGLQLAFGKSWSSHFQEWSLVNAKDRSSQEPQETPLGTCVEGIRVEDVTPGFRSSCFYAMANASGASAPRTDVARTVLENTPERQALLEKVFRQYSKSIASEVMALRERGFSLTWSAQEARFLASPLSRRAAQDPLLAAREIAKIPSVVIDDGEKRHLRTPADIKAMRVFWTVESNFFRSAESLLRETPSTASVTSLTQALGVRSFDIPSGPLVTSGAAYASTPLMVGREVSRVVLRPRERRVDLAWENRDDPARWWDLMPDRAAVADRLPWYSDALMGRAISRTRESERILVARPSSVDVDGQESLTVVRSRGLALVLPGSPIADYLSDVLDHCEERDDELAIAARVLLAEASAQFTRRASPLPGMDQSSILEYLERLRGDIFRRERHAGDELVDVDEFARALTREPIRVFDSWAWNRATDGAQDG